MRAKATFISIITNTLLCSGLLSESVLAAESVDFDKHVAAILIDNCLSCHSGPSPKGGLDLGSREAVLKGGESGPALSPKLKESLIWQRVSSGEMPPKKPLAANEVKVIEGWISAGAKWGTDPIDPFRVTTKKRAGADWWALQPLIRPTPPNVAEHSPSARNAIDAFVRKQLAKNKLTPSERSTPRVIIRRLSFDLIGLPPTPEEVAEFEAAAERDFDAAVLQLADRLLKSRHFGERWGRHWLDVVRFGESQGFERDKLRDHSWHYRDWVINAFNTDMPYDEFVRHQLAGDVLFPDDDKAVTATGFLVAAPWDEVGQSMRSAAMKAVVRQDEIEDYVGTIGQTFLGLTVNCARCHDHKFDPITQKEYYQLASAVGGVRHGNRQVTSSTTKADRTKLNEQIDALQNKSLNSTVRSTIAC